MKERRLLVADICSLEILLEEVEDAITRRSPKLFIGLYPALSLVFRRDPYYRNILESARTYPDGMGVVLATRMHGKSVSERMATTDIVWDVLKVAERSKWRVLLYGGGADVLPAVRSRILDECPSLRIVGEVDGFSELDASALKEFAADLALVARGAPLQELWSYQVALQSDCPAVMTCGGLFDFIAGERQRAPSWARRSGVEWMFRVAQEPRRLLKRYAFGNSLFMVWTVQSLLINSYRRLVGR